MRFIAFALNYILFVLGNFAKVGLDPVVEPRDDGYRGLGLT